LKKTLSIFLILVFGYHWAGFWLIFKYRQYQIKESKWGDIENANHSFPELYLLKISNEEQKNERHFHWEEQGKEFVYHKKWYDVVEMVMMKDTTYFYCENDIDEEILVNSFKNKQESQLETERANLPKLLLLECYFTQLDGFFCYFPKRMTTHISHFINRFYCVFLEKHNPPPQS
jgi:hypothetical protein